MYRRALGDLRRVQADHPDLAMVYNNMGDELQAIGKPREAMEQFAQALAIWEKRLGPSFETTVALNNMGLAQLDLDEPAEGLRYFMRAQEVCEHALGPRHSWCGKNLEGLGEAYRLLGKPDAALDCFVRALAIVEAAHGPKNPQVVPSLLGLGRVELGHHAWANARAPLERALAIRQEEPGDGVELADVRFGLAQALWASDRVHARELAAQARESYVKAGTRRRKELVEATDWIAQHR
jgi:tetratricopeptide (TPR) repeat protein